MKISKEKKKQSLGINRKSLKPPAKRLPKIDYD